MEQKGVFYMNTFNELTISSLARYADEAAKQLSEKYEAFLDASKNALKDTSKILDALEELEELILLQSNNLNRLSQECIAAGSSRDDVKYATRMHTDLCNKITNGIIDMVDIITM